MPIPRIEFRMAGFRRNSSALWLTTEHRHGFVHLSISSPGLLQRSSNSFEAFASVERLIGRSCDRIMGPPEPQNRVFIQPTCPNKAGL